MEKKDNIKYYFVISNERLMGYTTDKEMAEAFIAMRGENLKIKKIKEKKLKKDNINLNSLSGYEIVYPVCSNIPLTSDEEEYFYESIDQYLVDIMFCIGKFLPKVKLLKFDKDSQKYIDRLCELLGNRHDECATPDYDFDPMEYLMEIMDMDVVVKWFIEHCC